MFFEVYDQPQLNRFATGVKSRFHCCHYCRQTTSGRQTKYNGGVVCSLCMVYKGTYIIKTVSFYLTEHGIKHFCETMELSELEEHSILRWQKDLIFAAREKYEDEHKHPQERFFE